MITHLSRKFLFLFLTSFVVGLLSSCEKKEPHYTIGVIQWTEDVEPYVQSYKGVLDSLNENGYLEGVNLSVDYVNVEQDNAQALLSVKRFIEKKVNLIVALGTGSALAAHAASQ